MDAISRMEEQDIDKLSRILKINDNLSVVTSNNGLTEDNLDRLNTEKAKDGRSLTEKLNSIKPREEYINFAQIIVSIGYSQY